LKRKPLQTVDGSRLGFVVGNFLAGNARFQIGDAGGKPLHLGQGAGGDLPHRLEIFGANQVEFGGEPFALRAEAEETSRPADWASPAASFISLANSS
jgi:hypothetical protein